MLQKYKLSNGTYIADRIADRVQAVNATCQGARVRVLDVRKHYRGQEYPVVIIVKIRDLRTGQISYVDRSALSIITVVLDD